jgi:hypothetical protein
VLASFLNLIVINRITQLKGYWQGLLSDVDLTGYKYKKPDLFKQYPKVVITARVTCNIYCYNKLKSREI